MTQMLPGLARYKNVQITTSSGGDLLLLLYDGFFRFCAEAKEALASGDRAAFGAKAMRAHAIIEHLATVLDRKAAPDIADRLLSLYVFTLERLSEANMRRDAALIDEAQRAMAPVRDAFHQVIRGPR
jgi:flagellar secretion chaperone FliS